MPPLLLLSDEKKARGLTLSLFVDQNVVFNSKLWIPGAPQFQPLTYLAAKQKIIAATIKFLKFQQIKGKLG